jgi:hypothetical protein
MVGSIELDDLTIRRGRVCEEGKEVVSGFWKAEALTCLPGRAI